jgi:hypothetical protein
MRLEPSSQEPAELQRWLDTFAAANASMVSWHGDVVSSSTVTAQVAAVAQLLHLIDEHH